MIGVKRQKRVVIFFSLNIENITTDRGNVGDAGCVIETCQWMVSDRRMTESIYDPFFTSVPFVDRYWIELTLKMTLKAKCDKAMPL